MRDVSALDTSIEFMGETWTTPMALAPIGLGGMMARRGEVQAKKAADAFGIPFCLSTASICSLEDVAKASKRAYLYLSRSPEEIALMRKLKKMLDPKETLNPGKIFAG